jgi:hypothetical protein
MRTACAAVLAALLVPALAGCSGTERVCPPVGWGGTLVVELGPDWPDLVGASVRLADGDPVPVRSRSTAFSLVMPLPSSVAVTVLDAGGASLAAIEEEPDWRRVGGSAECGGPSEATVVVDP